MITQESLQYALQKINKKLNKNNGHSIKPIPNPFTYTLSKPEKEFCNFIKKKIIEKKYVDAIISLELFFEPYAQKLVTNLMFVDFCVLGDINAFNFIIERGAEINYNNNLPFITACQNGNLNLVLSFVEMGIKPNNVPRALIEAVINQQKEIVTELIKVELDININNGEALRLCVEKNLTDMVDFLIKCGANVNVLNDRPLIIAVNNGFVNIVKVLLNNGANPNVWGGYCFMKAMEKNYLEILEMLSTKKRDIDMDKKVIVQPEIWIETDLEPDDIMALYILPKAKYYVVGEGDANIKYNRMLKYCAILKNRDAVIIEGMKSDKKFIYDGHEFNNLSQFKSTECYLKRFQEFSSGQNPIMFSLKPMRELVNEYIKSPNTIKQMISNVTLYVYGSFNFRCITWKYKDELLNLLRGFKKVCIYESFFVSGNENSINKVNASELYTFMKNNKNDYFDALFRLTENWNKYISEDAIKCLSDKNLDKDACNREQKILDNIRGNEDFQYVLADFGLAAIYRHIDPIPVKNLQFNSYTSFDLSDENTNIYVYQKIPREVIIGHFLDCLKMNK
jgi:ankyrin repeat protein